MSRHRTAIRTAALVIASRPLRRIEAAYFGFHLVEPGTWIAILVYAHDATGPDSVGVVAVAQLIPAALYAPFAAGLGDRLPRLQVLLGGYALITVSLLAVAAAMLLGAHPLVVYILGIVATSVITMPRPMQAAILPAYAETPEQLTAANGITTVVEGVGVLLGPLGAGLLMAVAPPGVVFLAGGVVAGVSTLLIAPLALPGLRARGGQARADAADAGSAADAGAAADAADAADRLEVPSAAAPRSMLDGVRAITRDAGQLLVVLILGSRFVVAGALDVLLVLMATEALALAGAGAGYLGAALGLGGILGGALTVVVVGRRGLPGWIVAGTVACGIAVAVVAVVPAFAVIVALLAVAGIGLAGIDVAGRTLLQRIADREVLAEVFGLVEGFAMLGLAVGSVGAAALYASVGLTGALVATALVMPALSVAAWARLRRAEDALELPDEQIALLQALPLFAAVAPPALESAARRLRAFELPAGASVFGEGDRGDRFYVVADGQVAISRGSTRLRTLGPGSSFGEIALLRDVPRTATATAATDVRLWALDRDAFVLAITGSPQAVTEAHAHAEATLAADRARP